MSEKKYLGSDGLVRLVANIIDKFSPKTHTHVMADITDFEGGSGSVDTEAIVQEVLDRLPAAEGVSF